MSLVVHVTRRRRVVVESYAAASSAVTGHWWTFGSSQFYADPLAGFIEADGAVVAHVSYNGRVWKGAARFDTGKEEMPL